MHAVLGRPPVEVALPLIQIDTCPQRHWCRSCERRLIEPHFWGRVRVTQTWQLFRQCGSCRRHQQVNRHGEATPMTPHPSLGTGTSGYQRNDVLEATLRARRARFAQGVGYCRDGQLRCPTCHSTVYCETTVLRGQRDHPSSYIMEWLCWGSGHVVGERWRSGSPVAGRYPTPIVPPVTAPPVPSSPHLAPIGASTVMVALGRRTAWRRQTMRVVHLDDQLQVGCDERCRLLQYVDPSNATSPIYITRLHSPHSHNEYGGSNGNGHQLFEWRGLRIDPAECYITVDGVSLVQQVTRIEWQLLRGLLRDVGQIVPQAALIKRTWGEEYDGNDAHLLRVRIARVRKKLDPTNSDRFITTRPGIGYGIALVTNESAATP